MSKMFLVSHRYKPDQLFIIKLFNISPKKKSIGVSNDS